MPFHRIRFRAGRSYWAVLLFFLGFAALITLVSFYYLIPAMQAALDATQKQKRGLVAYSWLLLAIVLFILFVGLMMTFRFGRFFQPRTTPPPSKTKYVDAWAESAKRISVPTAEDDDEDSPA
jgi:heme/copper-type cytochrome/quinol oxidase subunit 2